jgi:prepilin-type N-terminal cleavage/methylation domain-containing protein
MVNKNSQQGFSLIELIVVCVILGILAVVTFPYLRKAKSAAESGSNFATMRTMLAAEYSYYAQNGRYARLDELNASQYGTLGTTSGNPVIMTRGTFTFTMNPSAPTDVQLKQSFTFTATKATTSDESPVVMTLTERGPTSSLFGN